MTIVTWAEDQGATLSPGLSVGEISTNNHGILSDGKNTEVSVSIPLGLAIHPNLVDASIYGDAPNDSKLKLYLARERNDADNKWKPYFDSLPQLSSLNSPLTWSPEDQELLKGTNLGGSLKDHMTKLIEEWWVAIEKLPETTAKPANHFMNQKFYYESKFYTPADMYKYISEYDPANWTSYPAYLWASLIIKSRAFPAYLAKSDIGDVKPSDCMLLPLIDLLNHNPKAKVDWVIENGRFTLKTEQVTKGEVFNNYGAKGNEELLLGYGFVLDNNASDTAAVKIKIPDILKEELKVEGVDLPTIGDYTMSVVDAADIQQQSTANNDGTLFFISETHLPPALVSVFSVLVRNRWDGPKSLRARLMGLSSLEQALEAKMGLINVPTGLSDVETTVRVYSARQKAIFKQGIKNIKNQTKSLFGEHKSRLVTLKTVWKYDTKLVNGLLLAFGFTSLPQVEEHQFQDHLWLLWFVRCANRDKYLGEGADEEGDENNWLPEWVKAKFDQLLNEVEVTPQEIVAYKDIYQQLVPPLAQAVPEVFATGDWGVKNFIVAAKLLDLVSFVRGKDQECIVVRPGDE